MIPTDPVNASTLRWCVIGGLSLFALCWWVIPALLHKLWAGRAGFVRRNVIDSDPCPERTHPKPVNWDLYDIPVRRPCGGAVWVNPKRRKEVKITICAIPRKLRLRSKK